MRGHFDLISMFGGLLIGFAFVILARWRMQVAYVRTGGVLDNNEKPEPEVPLGKVVINAIVAIALYFLSLKTTFEIAHLAVAAVSIGFAWQGWKLTKVYKIQLATSTDRVSIYVLLALSVGSFAYSLHVALRGIYGVV